MKSFLAKIQQHYLWFFLISGFILYGNTLSHNFTLDDAIVIKDNSFTKKGFSGIWEQLSNDQFVGFYGEKKELVSGGRYRPLSMVLFNIEYAIAGDNPFLYHLLNVLFYILNGILLYLVFKKLLFNFKEPFSVLSITFLATALWFFHPIHTEVVANIKGRDEIMAFCGELITLYFVLKYMDSKNIKELIFAALAFFLALLSKENAITWLAVIPLALYIFKTKEIKAILIPFAGLMLTAVLWFFIRYQVVGGGIENVADNLMNDPFLESTISEKYATIVLTLGKYIQLLFFPHPLTYDYYPKHIPIVSWSNPLVIISLFAYVFLIAFTVYGILKRKLVAFGVALFLITLSIASNLVFPIGAFMNERFIYVSSFGFTLILAFYLLKYLAQIKGGPKKAMNQLAIIGGIILLFYATKTISRNRVWKDNLSLATHDANISVNGAKSNVMAGGLLTEEAAKTTNPIEKKELLEKAIFHLNRAVNIYPQYIDALILLGNAQWEYTKDAKYALPYYQRILNINNQHQNAWQNIFIVLEQVKDVDYRINTYQNLLKYNQRQAKIYLNLGRAYGREKNQLNKSIQLMEEGLKFDVNNFDLLSNLGTAYGLQKDYNNAIRVLKRAVEIRPNTAKTYVDLGLSYYYNNQLQAAKQSFDQAKSIDASIDRSKFPV